ncbi:MAG: hypothetical protein ACQEWV_30295 [Bacillota bacterium]
MSENKWVFILLILIMLSITTQAYADVRVKGHFRKDGTYVKPHYRSDPDGNYFNNWSTYGNINPYTGEEGTKRYPEYNFSPYTYNLFSYWSNENSDDNSNFFVENYYDHNTIVDTSIGNSENTNTTPLESSENINIADSYINSYDTADEIEAKTLIVQYFNYVNRRAYRLAYDCWGTDWQSRHPYGAFEDGYVDVINQIMYINATSNEKGITLDVTIIAKEGWEQIKHQYHIVYNVQKIEDKWKMINGKGKLVW